MTSSRITKLAVVGALVAAALWVVYNVGTGLQGAAKAELRSVLSHWNSIRAEEGGDPVGFMSTLPPGIVVSNRTFLVGNTSYTSLFANTSTGSSSTMFITSNGVVVLLDSRGHPNLLE